MKHVFRTILLTALVIATAGCASTETKRSAGEVIDDSAISSKIKTALLADKLTDGLDIEVEINDGRVQLNGFADNKEELKRAEEIARSTKGVTSVSNNLRVAEGSRTMGRYLDDKVLVGRVNGALAKDLVAEVLSVEVEVNRGVVTLGGFVDNRDQQKAAGDAARRVDGIEKVINNLEVRK